MVVLTKSCVAPSKAYGVRPEINASLAPYTLLNASATTAAECQDLVRRDYPEANAAEYSNIGGVWCKAAFNACVPIELV